jgi:hypothetical protein
MVAALLLFSGGTGLTHTIEPRRDNAGFSMAQSWEKVERFAQHGHRPLQSGTRHGVVDYIKNRLF